MFSKNMAIIIGVVILIATTTVILSINSRESYPSYYGLGRVGIAVVAPIQEVVTNSIRFVRDVWSQYFFLINTAKENRQLRLSLSKETEKSNLYDEIQNSNKRLRKLLNFQENITKKVLSAEVIGRDPSPWFKTVIIDKGRKDNLRRGLPVVISEGIIGQVIEVSELYSKVLLIIDQNSAVDALVQRTRARGVIKGKSEKGCIFKYVLRKDDVQLGDIVVSSGLDGVFPKGLRIGQVSEVVKKDAGIFQQVAITPYVDFEKLEEVLVIQTFTEPEF